MNETLTKEELELINQFTRRNLSQEELYTFSVILCDNEVDRDNEKFTIFALHKLAELYVGKSGIFDRNMKSNDQTARIYAAEVMTDKTRKTADGEDYTYIKAKAYMVRTEKNKDIIAEIDAGIKIETSVGCCIKEISCSICGRNIKTEGCEHQKGKVYGNKSCCYLLSEPTDAYEWSFVAIPAQKAVNKYKCKNLGGRKMKNYIKLNGKKIELNDTQVEEIKRSFGIGAKKLSEIPEGGTFKIGAYEMAVLEQLDGHTVVIKNDKYGKNIKFGGNNNYDGSDADEVCNKFGDEIAEIIGAENMLEFDLDLTANDGMKCYGSVKRKCALRTVDMQRKYAYIFDKLPKFYEWTATAYSTPKHDDSTGVECVSPLGGIRCSDCIYDYYGVRPFCILKSDIFVSE